MTSAAQRASLFTAAPFLDREVRTHPCKGAGSVRSSPEAFGTKPMIGKLLGGRYRLERELGEGGMGAVYLARDEQIAGESFAVKVMKQIPHPEVLALLREEVGRTRRLSHPNIVDVHSLNVDDERLYVLMEYLEGRPLSALVNEEFGRGMSFSRAWPIIEDVGAALGYAHDHNVVHSDLKPANVLMTTSGKAKLLDFGISRLSRGPRQHTGGRPEALTPAYASCEMLEGQEADRRDDVYSFACVIYQMLSGDRPYGDLTALEAREACVGVPPLPGLSAGQNAAIVRALAFQRQARTGSVEELLAGLASHARPPGRLPAFTAGVILTGIVTLGLAYLAVDKPWLLSPRARSAVAATAVAFNPPPHSVAVLPFVNMSGDREQDFFSEGLTEELLNSLARVNELQVAARTSSFSFQGQHPDIATVGHKLNVASVLEGSVRRSGSRLRVTVQLNDAVTGFNLWSQAYDRNLGDILKLQTDIANAVAGALKIRLLDKLSEKIELGGTRNAAAFDAYLRATKALASLTGPDVYKAALAQYTQAIRLDPSYALAFAGRSRAYTSYAATGTEVRASFNHAHADAGEAIALAPGLAEGHMALGFYSEFGALDFAQARQAYDRARTLAPGNAKVLRVSGSFLFSMGQFDEALSVARRAVALDPLNRSSHDTLGLGLYLARRYAEAIRVYADSITLDPAYQEAYAVRGLAYYGLGDLEKARASCEAKRDYWVSEQCLAVVYDKLG
jgi:eukaryotic-like serine/threonine-protein kinase